MITLDAKQLIRALDLAHLAVEKRNTIPALGALKVTANGNLRIEGTDLDLSTMIVMPYDGLDDAAFSLTGTRALRAALRAAPSELVSLAKMKACDKVQISSGRMQARLGTLPADDHPGAWDTCVGQEDFSVEIGKAELDQIARLIPAISREDTRYYLNGIAVRHLADWTWRFVATDGHRLAIVDIPLPAAKGAIPDNTIMPRAFVERAMVAFGKGKEPVRVAYGSAHRRNGPSSGAMATAGRGPARISLASTFDGIAFNLSSKLIDGTYPDVSRVIPHGYTHLCRVERAELLRAIGSLQEFGTGKSRAVKLRFAAGLMICSLNSPDLGEGTYDVPCEHNIADGGVIGFNARYLLDSLRSLTGTEAEIHVAGGSDMAGAPALIRDPADTAFFSVLMPMRV